VKTGGDPHADHENLGSEKGERNKTDSESTSENGWGIRRHEISTDYDPNPQMFLF